mgnify:FL=1
MSYRNAVIDRLNIMPENQGIPEDFWQGLDETLSDARFWDALHETPTSEAILKAAEQEVADYLHNRS